MKIYTKKGDLGYTTIIGGEKLIKCDHQIEAYGSVDELIAFTGYLKDQLNQAHLKQNLLYIQDRLMAVCAILAKGNTDRDLPSISEKDILQLEKLIDEYQSDLTELNFFLLPGGHPLVSLSHICRTVCRRAERQVIRLSLEKETNPITIKYLNRLSDFFFALSRRISKDYGSVELKWEV